MLDNARWGGDESKYADAIRSLGKPEISGLRRLDLLSEVRPAQPVQAEKPAKPYNPRGLPQRRVTQDEEAQIVKLYHDLGGDRPRICNDIGARMSPPRDRKTVSDVLERTKVRVKHRRGPEL